MVSFSETRGQVELPFLVPAYDETEQYWDSEYEGILTSFMERKPTPKNAISFRASFGAAQGRMAQLAKETTPAVYWESAAYMDSYFTRIAKTGWKMEPTMWDEEIQHGKMTLSLEEKINESSMAHMRREDFEGLKVVFGDSVTLNRYSTQNTDRLKSWEIDSSTDGLIGNSWGTITGTTSLPDILHDLDTIQYNAKLLGDFPMRKFIIAPKTFYVMQRNQTIKDDIKYVHDVRDGIVGASLRGLNIKEINYARYKDDSGYSDMAGAPGIGSLMYDTWSSMKSKHMMRHEPGDGSTYEFGLITADKLGYIYSAPVYTSPGFPTGSDVSVMFDDPETLTKKAWRARRMGFRVKDYGNLHKVLKITTV